MGAHVAEREELSAPEHDHDLSARHSHHPRDRFVELVDTADIDQVAAGNRGELCRTHDAALKGAGTSQRYVSQAFRRKIFSCHTFGNTLATYDRSSMVPWG